MKTTKNKLQMKTSLLLAFICLSKITLASSWFSKGSVNDPLTQAHHNFLDGNITGMAAQLKDVLMSSDEIAKVNALALLEKAYQTRGGNIPVDWKLPADIKRMTFMLRHDRTPDRESFGVKVMGAVAKKGIIKQLQVVQYPDKVILDIQGKVGHWEEEVNFGNGLEFQLQNLGESEPIKEGLYLLNLELTSGEVTHGWFIVSKLLSSDTPSIKVPSVGQTMATTNPTIKWQEFYSPEYQSFESRAVWLAAWGPDKWECFIQDPTLTEITVGDPRGQGATKLSDGRYSFVVGYREIRKFGDLQLARQSFSSTPGYIKHN